MHRLAMLSFLFAACGSSSTKPSTDDGGGELLVWSADDGGETLWLRDGEVIAKARGVFVAGPERAWELMLVPREITDMHACSDGYDPDAPEVARDESTKTSILVLVARPLDNSEPQELAAQMQGDSATCGVPGVPPALTGGIGTFVAFTWSEGMTTSAAVGEESSPYAVVYDLYGALRVPLDPQEPVPSPRDVLLNDGQDRGEECEAEDPDIEGPMSLRMTLDDGPHFAAAYLGDGFGVTCDRVEWVEVKTSLGLGVVPAAAVEAGMKVWGGSSAYGISWVPNDMKVRVQLQRAFGL